MSSFIIWYFTLTFLGLVTFPLAYWLLPGLPDRGYAFSRTLGLLLWAFVFWMLASLRVLGNNPGGLIFALIVLLVLSGWAATRVGMDNFRAWWERQRGAVLVGELLFLGAFGLMTYLRGANPDLASTEKPMDLMFINSVLRSPTFPPHDSWLAGYAISYYYFGYVMTAMLAMITNVTTPVAFSLMLATVFALGGMGAWGVAYNLLERGSGGGEKEKAGEGEMGSGGGGENGGVEGGRKGDEEKRGGELEDGHNSRVMRNALLALLAPVFVLLVSNAEAFLEVLHARGIGWSDGQGIFWQWLNVKDLVNPPAASLDWPPPNRGWGWWWRASRVVNDVSFAGSELEIIDEFPFFSFLLGDLHPHVLAIPFAFLAMGLSMNVFLNRETESINLFGFQLHLSKFTFALAAVTLGGLAFLNTWDFPIYVALFAGAYALKRAWESGWAWNRAADFAVLGAALGVAGVVLYLPFYIGFSSQAGGFLPNLLNPTRGAHLWVMFGTLLIPLLAYLWFQWQASEGNLRQGLLIAAGFSSLLLVLALAMGGIIALTPAGQEGINLLGAPDAMSFLRESISRRATGIAGLGTLIVLMGLSVAAWVRRDDRDEEAAEPEMVKSVEPGHFAVLMILIGTLLVLGPEFVYLRDQFGWRMNTVFKFYYQTWLLWGTAAGFGAAYLLQKLRGGARVGIGLATAVCIGIGLLYPILGMPSRTNNFQNPWTLDGTGYSHLSGDDVAAVEWLKTAPIGTLVEATSPGASYTGYGRISGHSGIPTLLGWPGHEGQWRGGYEEQGSRLGDIETIYRTGSWSQTEELLKQYNVRYIVVGNLERSTYSVNETKFRRFLTPVFEQGNTVIFEYEGGVE